MENQNRNTAGKYKMQITRVSLCVCVYAFSLYVVNSAEYIPVVEWLTQSLVANAEENERDSKKKIYRMSLFSIHINSFKSPRDSCTVNRAQ